MREGIDVSEHQGNISWREVALAADFAFIRATYGETDVDKMFSAGRVKAATKCLPWVGYYSFAYPSGGDAKKEARHFVETVQAAGGELGRPRLDGKPLSNGVLDYESARKDGRPDDQWVTRWVNEYKRLVGLPPMIYGGNVLREQEIGSHGCDLWLAVYGIDPNRFIPEAWKHWEVWQYTDRGTCPGVRGPVDRNKVRP